MMVIVETDYAFLGVSGLGLISIKDAVVAVRTHGFVAACSHEPHDYLKPPLQQLISSCRIED